MSEKQLANIQNNVAHHRLVVARSKLVQSMYTNEDAMQWAAEVTNGRDGMRKFAALAGFMIDSSAVGEETPEKVAPLIYTDERAWEANVAGWRPHAFGVKAFVRLYQNDFRFAALADSVYDFMIDNSDGEASCATGYRNEVFLHWADASTIIIPRQLAYEWFAHDLSLYDEVCGFIADADDPDAEESQVTFQHEVIVEVEMPAHAVVALKQAGSLHEEVYTSRTIRVECKL